MCVSPIQPLPVVNRITIRPYKQADYEVLVGIFFLNSITTVDCGTGAFRSY